MENSYFSVFQRYFPPGTAEYCYQLWRDYDFYFLISKPRKTKLGDYRHHPEKGTHRISVNADLNPYSFLVTYIHEVAHMETFLKHQNAKKKLQPHGPEWKAAYRQLFEPLLSPEKFPEPVFEALRNHLQNPGASSCADFHLLKVLNRHYRSTEDSETLLDEVPEGQVFSFQQRTFRKLYLRRTRVVCEEVRTRKKFLISKAAFVSPLAKSNPNRNTSQ